ncbi:MAG TPA: glycosyltransferase, partial [Saprospiraceae bacterium]|nr:glycosyltransferase [Saprospiraceae bacterium]
MASSSTNSLFSIILLSYHSEERIGQVFEKVTQRLDEEKINFEFIIIDDGSKDGSYAEAKKLSISDKRVRPFRLSKNYTSPYSQFAGYCVAKGDCVVAITDDLQKPLDVVVEMYRAWEQGAKIVVSYRKSRNDGRFSDFF